MNEVPYALWEEKVYLIILPDMQNLENKPKENRNYGLDVLKAISIIFVLVLHLNPLQINVDSHSKVLLKIPSYLLAVFNQQIAPVAVPTFILVSLYLFCLKSVDNISYLKRRIINLAKIYLFWSLIQSSLYLMTAIFSSLTQSNITLPKFSIIQAIVEGGPPLPIVSGSVFYFLFDLIILTIVAFFYNKLNEGFRGIADAVVILFFLGYFELLGYNNSLIYWRLDNYIIYVPVAMSLTKHLQQHFRLKYFYLLVFIVFTIHDIYLKRFGYSFSGNGRVSIFFGVVTFLCFVCSWDLRENKYIQLLSRYSLGIFATHKYWQILCVVGLTWLSSALNVPELLNIFGLKLNILALGTGLLTLILTLIFVYILKSTAIKKFIY